jgi:catechol 2,3-dioxygenase-like lactoylglutathione lyase family enzyme
VYSSLTGVSLIGKDAKTFYRAMHATIARGRYMAEKFDRIVLAVPELRLAIEQYQLLLGRPPWLSSAPDKKPFAWWGLSNTVIELVQYPVLKAAPLGIVFSSSGAEQAEVPLSNRLHIDIRLGDGSATADFRRLQPGAQCTGLSVDHVVLRTGDAEACIDLFGGELGIRLALDTTAPQWGGRMLFFRAGKLTLEVIESADEKAGATAFWGLAYQCQNLEDFARALADRGVLISDIREGRKPGTRVATVKSHCLGIPTLLIQGVK